MRVGYANHAHGPRVLGRANRNLRDRSELAVPRDRAAYPAPHQARQGARLDREPSIPRSLRTRHGAAVAPPATPTDQRKPPQDRAPPARRQRTLRASVFAFGAHKTSSLYAAWLVVAALLLGLALLSAVSDAPRTPSRDELARASLRTPHERATSGQY